MKKICVVTGSRAEYGLMSRLMRLIDDDPEFTLQIVATNMHLSPEFGLTYREIEADGFAIDRKVEMLLSSDSANGTVKSIGLGTIGLADAYSALQPDLILILGDRYEMLAAVAAALIYKIPVGHISGGDVTEGAYDDAIRHAITKMSHLHFPTTERYRQRVIQLGESPERVFNTGALNIDNIRHTELLPLAQLQKSLNFPVDGNTALVTFHPETLQQASPAAQFDVLTEALDSFPDLKLIFTKPNSDTRGRELIVQLDRYVSGQPERAVAFTSLGHRRYLSCFNQVGLVIGNSSSGISEAPSFHIPTVNIGDRQKGRLHSGSVIDCPVEKDSIAAAIRKARSPHFREQIKAIKNIYEQPETAARIVAILKKTDFKNLIPKSFYDLNQTDHDRL